MSKKKSRKKNLPDLAELENSLSDARALVKAGYQVVVQHNNSHGASVVLRCAIEALDRVAEQLNETACQLASFRKEGAS